VNPEAINALLGSSVAVGLLVGAVVALFNSWRV
jgi:hypothetical protein